MYIRGNFQSIKGGLRMRLSITIIGIVSMLFVGLIFGQSSPVELTKPFANSKITLDGVPLIMELNLWNVKNYKGETKLAWKDNVVSFYCDMKETTLLNPPSWVWAYPEVYHGYKPWSGNQTSSPVLKLPKKFGEVQGFSVEIEYNLSHEKELPMNFALESWFTTKQYPNTVTRGDAEVMIWTYYNGMQPAGKKVGEITLTTVINGKEMDTTWEIWYQPMAWDYVAFRLTKPICEGKIRLPVYKLYKKAKEVLMEQSDRISSLDELYLEDLELGSEYGSPNITKARLDWELTMFRIIQE